MWQTPVSLSKLPLDDSWRPIIEPEFQKDYIDRLESKLNAAIKTQGTLLDVFPPPDLVFNAFNQCSFDNLKVVIIGQDPYIRRGPPTKEHPKGQPQAMGMSFSVPRGVAPPPSLRNIFKELEDDPDVVDFSIPTHGDLTGWARQGVLMLNYTLTVREGTSNSHASFGWHRFTDSVISEINKRKQGVVFMLWGNFARKKAALIDGSKHHIFESSHPSPLGIVRRLFFLKKNCMFSLTVCLSGYKKGSPPFWQCRMFSKCNKVLDAPIDWGLL